jgi:ssDNA-binding Zn-finger/Zn-ribbon topoisomerase 1
MKVKRMSILDRIDKFLKEAIVEINKVCPVCNHTSKELDEVHCKECGATMLIVSKKTDRDI